jgi:HAD superfamily hydrolase (TIGR01450 family)
VIAFDGLVCDLDGVVYKLDQPIEGAPHAVNALKDLGVRVIFCTNNSSSTPERFAAKLTAMGLRAGAGDVITSSVVTAEVLRGRGWTGKGAYVVGAEGIRAALASVGVRAVGAESCELVVVGIDTAFDYSKLDAAATAVRRGVPLIATNDDATLPSPSGAKPGAGSILAAIETASGTRAEVMGKPHEPMMHAVARRLEGCKRIAVVGDRPETDLVGGVSRGWTTILVTSGVTSPEAVSGVTPAPDLVVGSIAELVDIRG